MTTKVPGSTPRTSCRICGSSLTEFLNFGDMPLANGLLDSPDQHEERYPLRVMFCASCGLVQLGDVVDPALMFNPAYAFRTGSSARMVEHYAVLFDEYHIGGGVVEIGGNDSAGWLASQSCRKWDDYINIDPTRNECFTLDCAQRIEARDGKMGLIVACNVLGHVDDLHDFMRGVKTLLHPEGVFIVEVPYLPCMSWREDVGQIYHEHCSFYTVHSLDALMERHGLQIDDVTVYPVHGGTIRCVIRHGTKRSTCTDKPVKEELKHYAHRIVDHRFDLMHTLARLKEQGKRVVGYCASAKGTMILNYGKIDTDLLPWIMDNTLGKQGRYVPGTHQLIVPPKEGFGIGVGDHDKPDAVVVLSANHLDEIKAKHPEFKGEWIVA